MKLSQFSVHNSVQEQVNKESLVYWAKSRGYMTPTPEYTKTHLPFTKTVIHAFSKEINSFLKP